MRSSVDIPKIRLARLLSCIRFDEVLILQGPPLLGAALSIGTLSADKIVAFAILLAADLCLVAHVFTLNDWAGIADDLRDPNRSARTFVSKGVRRTEVGCLAVALLLVSLLLSAQLSATALSLAAAIAGLSALYSLPAPNLKAMPIANSLLHLAGGSLHFLFGFCVFKPLDGGSVLTSLFFALVFTAGHLMHEARGLEGDLANGIQTNAVVFGRRRSLVAGLTLFTAAQISLVKLATFHVVPHVLVFTSAIYPLHLLATWKALAAGATVPALCRLQKQYRILYALIGIVMVVGSRWN